MTAEFREFAPRASPAIGGNGLDQRGIQREQIDIDEWRRLVEHVVGQAHRNSPFQEVFKQSYAGAPRPIVKYPAP